jgi:hypothetical protein
LLKASPLVAWLISVPDDVSLEELHDVLQFVFGWSGQAWVSADRSAEYQPSNLHGRQEAKI